MKHIKKFNESFDKSWDDTHSTGLTGDKSPHGGTWRFPSWKSDFSKVDENASDEIRISDLSDLTQNLLDDGFDIYFTEYDKDGDESGQSINSKVYEDRVVDGDFKLSITKRDSLGDVSMGIMVEPHTNQPRVDRLGRLPNNYHSFSWDYMSKEINQLSGYISDKFKAPIDQNGNRSTDGLLVVSIPRNSKFEDITNGAAGDFYIDGIGNNILHLRHTKNGAKVDLPFSAKCLYLLEIFFQKI
jgi:hypothetical protein